MADLVGVNGQRTDFKVVGKPNVPGKLSYAIASGRAKYGIDYIVPAMLHAKFLKSPYANAMVRSVDISAAKALPGVVDIILWDDPDIKALAGRSYGGAPTPYLDNFADNEGAEVAVIVVAETEELCDEALNLLNVDWDVRPHVVNLRAGRTPDAPVVRPNPRGKGNVQMSNVDQGDVEEGFKQADQIIEFDFYTPANAAHIPNPAASVAWWFHDPLMGEGKSLHIEGAVREKSQICMMYGLPEERVVQEGLYHGGKYCDWGLRKSQTITPLLAKRTGRPVRVAYERADMYDFGMCERFSHLKVGFKNTGLITAIDDHSIAEGGTRGHSSFGNTMDQTFGPYLTTKCEHVKQSMEIVNSNRGKMWVSGPQNPFNWDALTVAIHMIADKLGKDPVEIATLNIHGPNSQDDPTVPPSYQACVEAGKKLMKWQRHPAGTKKMRDGRMHGAAFRYQMCPRHSVSGYDCLLELKNGEVHMPTQGPYGGMYALECNANVIAEELGLKFEDIHIDVDHKATYRPVGGGADGTTASSWVVKECANLLKQKILDTVIAEAAHPPAPSFGTFRGASGAPSPFKGLTPADLDIKDGKVFAKSDTSKAVPFAQATRAHLYASFAGRPPAALWTQRGKMLDTMVVDMCEVAVDAETGEVEVLRFDVAADPGKILRRTSFEGQIVQQVNFSAGCQLFEDIVYDQNTGVRLTANAFEYKKPTILDLPSIDMDFMETRVGNAAYGASGIAHSVISTHLVVCAIQNAIGKWVDPPATPDRVLKALGKA